jgi:RNA polymerase sigma factor (sigma-70 family)
VQYTHQQEPAVVMIADDPRNDVIALVREYTDLVYSTARRQVGDPHLAEDVTQAVFVVLAKKINRIEKSTAAGWLVNAARLASREALRSKIRREKHEIEAARIRRQMGTTVEEPPAEEMLPLLDDALSRLREADRAAVVMRFLQGRSFAEIGQAMDCNEEAARKRVVRAVDKLRGIFMREGLMPSAGGLMLALATQQAPPAPTHILSSATSAAISSPSSNAEKLARGVITTMTSSKIKLVGAILTMVIIAGGIGFKVFPIHRVMAADAPAATPTPPPVNPAPAAQDVSTNATFRANIVDSITGKPVADVRLLSSYQQRPKVRGVADAAGNIAIDNIPPGKFQFDVQAVGYTRWWSEQCVSPFNQKTISDLRTGGTWQRNFDYLDFDVEPNMPPVTIIVERDVRIRGTVLDPDGNPVAKATVAPALTSTGNSLTGDTRFSVLTAFDGTFDMHLPASSDGQYNLVAHDGAYGKWRDWANGVIPPFKTKPGDELNDITIKLTRPGTVRGKAVDEQGNPAANAQVRASAFDRLENRYYDPTTKTDADGNFELNFVRPGKQYIQVAPFWLYATEAPDGSSQIVTVDETKPVEGVTLTVKPLNSGPHISFPIPTTR